MTLTLNIIAAVSENMGIGVNKGLPWDLKSDTAYYINKTTQTKKFNKQNAVIIGRISWECEKASNLPLNNRLYAVLTSRNDLNDVLTFPTLDEAIEKLSSSEYESQIEKIWIIGGSNVYKEAMESKYPCRLYLTRIYKHFDCDTFFPEIPDTFTEISDPEVPSSIQEENGIRYAYKVYEKIIF